MDQEIKSSPLAPGQGKTETVYLWTILVDRAHPYTTFSFTENRSRAGPDEFFRDYRGVLVCDAYTCYESLSADSQDRIVLAACPAHARRKFEALHKLGATEQTSTAMGYFQLLFDIEHQQQPLTDDDVWLIASVCLSRCWSSLNRGWTIR